MEDVNKIKPEVIFAGSLWEAEVIQGLLENVNIQSFVWDDVTGTIAPWRVTSGGVDTVNLMVSSDDFDEAKRVVNEFHATQPGQTD